MDNKNLGKIIAVSFWVSAIMFGIKAYGRHMYHQGMQIAQSRDDAVINAQEKVIKELTKKDRKD